MSGCCEGGGSSRQSRDAAGTFVWPGWWHEVVEVARGLSSHSTSCSGVDGSGCVWAWVSGGLGVAGVVGAGVCSGDGHEIGAGLVSHPCNGVRVEEIQNVSSHVTSKFIRLLSP